MQAATRFPWFSLAAPIVYPSCMRFLKDCQESKPDGPSPEIRSSKGRRVPQISGMYLQTCQMNDWVNLCVCIRLSGTEGESVLQIRKADLAQFLDSARDIGSNEHHCMPTVLDTVPEELLSDARPR